MTRDMRAAGAAVEAAAGEKGWNGRDLAKVASVDPGTVADLISGKRWPRSTTRARIEKALEWPSGSIHHVANGGAVPGASSSAHDRGSWLPPEVDNLSPRDRRVLLALVDALVDPGVEEEPRSESLKGYRVQEPEAPKPSRSRSAT